MTCSACGAPGADDARFCASCGRPLRSVEDERRVVTVVFADLVGFTSLSERLDPERVKNLVDRCFDRMADEITSYGGQVDKIVGDAVVALWSQLLHRVPGSRLLLKWASLADPAFAETMRLRFGAHGALVVHEPVRGFDGLDFRPKRLRLLDQPVHAPFNVFRLGIILAACFW